MTEYEKKSLEMELRVFLKKNFEKPSDCTHPDQIRYYISELCLKIEEYEKRYSYAPELAYTTLAQYTARQNSMVYKDFVNSY